MWATDKAEMWLLARILLWANTVNSAKLKGALMNDMATMGALWDWIRMGVPVEGRTREEKTR